MSVPASALGRRGPVTVTVDLSKTIGVSRFDTGVTHTQHSLDAGPGQPADGDSVALIKDLKVKGAGQTLKRGTVIKSIRLTGDPQEIDCRHDTIKGLVLRAEFVKKV